MKRVLLRLETESILPLDLEPLSTAVTRAPSLEALRRVQLWQGRRRVALGKLFQVGATKHDVDLELRKAKPFLQRVGAGLKSGRFLVHGDVGDYCGRGMSGGELLLRGSAGHGAGLEMQGGLLRIQGDCGDSLGGAAPGRQTGMQGGLILLRGSCGARAGEYMRRGLVVIQGDCGDCCALGMHAGTLAVLGKSGRMPGRRMRRGTLFLARAPRGTPPGFAFCASLEIGYLRLLRRHLNRLQRGLGAALIPEPPRVHRYMGDLVGLGKAELLVPLPSGDRTDG